MKVAITKDSLNYLTVNEHEHAKQMVRDFRADDMTAKDYADSAARAILRSEKYKGCYDCVREVLTASAEICRDNSTDYDRFGDGTGQLDIWIRATVETLDGFLKFGCLLSKVWDLCGDTDSANELARHAYIQYFTLAKA